EKTSSETWQQDYSDLEVCLYVSKTVVKGKQCVCVCVRVCLKEGTEEKCSEVWWNPGLKRIDVEEHAALDKLTCGYHQKLQGKPWSHEMKVHEMLKRCWDAEQSSCRGGSLTPPYLTSRPVLCSSEA
uniref:Uncharacterized protein n=1 Tax=Myripristis murdjan TaxID=586833 RepID=A0A667WKI2_9TELE